ncbi:hypothetical protein ABZT27_31835 [Streptomyces sp. NPDC005389]|uniref:hypothetical protein n=1 Tax=Streptomyces sp. NPDC005389 TaxID=3157040 RepID=UPI0033A050AC
MPTTHSFTEQGRARAEHDRGLYLVEALAGTWHTFPTGRGKTGWLETDLPE